MKCITKMSALLAVIFLLLPFTQLIAQQRSENDEFSYALKLYNEKFYDLAAQQFSRFSTNFPRSLKLDEAGFYTGMALYQMRDYQNARVEFQGVAVNFPESDRAAESWFKTGECYLALDNNSEAAKAFDTVNLLYPASPIAAEAIIKAGQLYLQTGDIPKAEKLFNLIQDRYVDSPYYFQSVLEHGKLFVQKGEFSKARNKFQKVLAGKPDKSILAEALAETGKLDHQQGYFSAAKKNFLKVINEYPATSSFMSSVLALADIELRDGNYKNAQNLLQKALSNLDSDSDKLDVQLMLADAQYLSGNYGLSLKTLDSVQLEQDDENALVIKLKRALCWMRQKSNAKALDILNSILTQPAYLVFPQIQLAKDLYFELAEKEKRYAEATKSLRYLSGTKSWQDKDNWRLVHFLHLQSDWDRLVREAAVMITEPRSIYVDDFLFEMGHAFEMLKDYEQAADSYEKLLNQYSASDYYEKAQGRLSYLKQHKLINQNLGITKLALLLGEVVNQQERGTLQLKLGHIYFEYLKDYPNALQQFKLALTSATEQREKANLNYLIGATYALLAEDSELSETEAKNMLEQARKYLGAAMEQKKAAANPDQIAWKFVQIGIRLDNTPPTKQVGYVSTLIAQYPKSALLEEWLAFQAKKYSLSDSTRGKAVQIYDRILQKYPDSKSAPAYLMAHARLIEHSNPEAALEDYKKIVSEFPLSHLSAAALFTIAKNYQDNGQYKESKLLFEKLLHDYYYCDLSDRTVPELGRSLVNSANYEEAIPWLYARIDHSVLDDYLFRSEFSDDAQVDYIFQLGKAYFFQSNYEKATENLSIYLAAAPKGNYRDAASFYLGEIALRRFDNEGAVNYFSRVSTADTSLYVQAAQKAAENYFSRNMYKQAAEKYQQVLGMKSGAKRESYIRGKYIVSLMRQGLRSKADKEIKAFTKKYKNRSEQLALFEFERGKQLRQSKNFSAALKSFSKVKKKYKNSSLVDDADYHSALTYITLNKMEDALDILTKFAQNYPKSDNLGAVFNTLGGIYFRSEKYESAIASFKSALKKSLPRDLKQQVMSNLIKAYTFVNYWDAALALARDYTDAFPDAEDRIDKQIIIAQAYVYLNQFDRAVELLKETRREADSEKEPEIQFYIGDAYLKAGQYENAIAEFVKIPLLSRKTKLQWEASALYYSGQAYEKLGRKSDAVRMYKEIVKRPGIDIVLKKDAQKRINQING